jgi:pimeloyl-ACP methyl ester carboxylesterase
MDAATQQPGGESAPTLVFLHGSGDSARTWDQVIARLPDFACVALDLPGHGTLADQPGPAVMTLGDYAEAVRRELMHRGLRDVCLIGHSLGSALALRLSADSPDLVSRIALVGAGARLRVLPALLEEARQRPESANRQLAEVGIAPGHTALRDELLAQPTPLAPGMLYRDLAACDGFDMMGELGQISQPALIVTGEEDRLTPPKYAVYLRDHLADATLVLVPGAGHYLPGEAPDVLAQALRDWLGRSRP